MSMEFNINFSNAKSEYFLYIANDIKNEFQSAEISTDGSSLWIPSVQANWIDFSIELTSQGFFIVSNLSGLVNKKIFSLIEKRLDSLGIDFTLEDV